MDTWSARNAATDWRATTPTAAKTFPDARAPPDGPRRRSCGSDGAKDYRAGRRIRGSPPAYTELIGQELIKYIQQPNGRGKS